MSKRRARVSVTGVVQGVGFRPFVYRVASENNLLGWVNNTSGGVEIEVDGEAAAVEALLHALRHEAPPQSRVKTVDVEYGDPAGFTSFDIRHSEVQSGRFQLVSPDIATCPDCRRELFDPADRRYRYPFLNCTNCGPRFTIIEDIPYDRPLTTMKDFPLCPKCRAEYEDPLDRRFHAQPNACPVCGPELDLTDKQGQSLATGDVVGKAAAFLASGKILAIKGLGGFHLACDATNPAAVQTLRARKRRVAKPFAVMIESMEQTALHCSMSEVEAELLNSSQCPIVVVPWNRETSNICDCVAPNLNYMGVMLPYTPLHHLLLAQAGRPLVMTSGNLSEEPIAKDNDEALARLGSIADFFVLHNRDILSRYDDSVFVADPTPVPLRRARGYAPYPITLPGKGRQVLACGAEEKNTFCLTRENYAFLSQHIGDMENLESLDHFEATIDLYKKMFRVEPELVAYDMHPEYLSTKYALELIDKTGLPGIAVQHHHAHIASCLVDNGHRGPVIGVALDGTGYGPDGHIWGGEFLVADCRGFERVGHLEYVAMPGGAAAIRRPYRMALGYLYTLFGPDVELDGLPLAKVPESERRIIASQVAGGLNSPLTSSAGRLFDAVSALAGVRQVADYQAQAAIELEMLASGLDLRATRKPYGFSMDGSSPVVVRLGPLLDGMLTDARGGGGAAAMGWRFHWTMAHIILAVCTRVSDEGGPRVVALSGGCFQNRLLTTLTVPLLTEAGFEVLLHGKVPCNDGAIALGQAAVALARVGTGIESS